MLAVLPYQLGYQPENSLVVICLRGGRWGLIERVFLPPPEHVVEAAATLLPALRQAAPEMVLLLGFEDTRGDSVPMIEAMERACHGADIAVSDRFTVSDGRWFSPSCHEPQCCPPEGRVVPEPADVPAVAELVGLEIAPAASRDALAERLVPTRPLLTRAIDVMAMECKRQSIVATARGRGREANRGIGLDAWARVLAADDGAVPVADLPPQELARAIAALADVDVRDGIIAWLCPGELSLNLVDPGLLAQLRARFTTQRRGMSRLDQIARHRVESRLVDLCACCPLRWAVAPLTVLASYSWWRGDGALTRIALDRALEGDPGYRLALLLERVVDLSIRPARATA